MNASRTSATEGTSNTRMSSGTALPRARALLAAALLSIAGCDFSPITNVGTEVEGLTGTLVTESGLPVAGAWVRVYPASPALLARPALEDAVADSARTNAAGTYLFKDLPDGHYNLAASARRGDTTLAFFLANLHVAGDTNIGTDTLHRSGTVILQARSGGSPVAGAACAIAGSPWLTVSDGAGICVLPGVAPGVYRVTVTHPSYLNTVSADVTVVIGDSTGAAAVDLIDTNAVILPPGVPVPVSPVNGALTETSVGLTWSGADGWTGPRFIERQIIEIALDSLFQDIVERDTLKLNATVSPSATLGRGGFSLAPGTTYWWRVTLQNEAGSVTSATAHFRTRPDAGAPGRPRLVAHWDFNEASGAQALDASGNGRHGVIAGPVVRDAGVQGTALQFNGTTSVVIADTALPPLGSFSLTAWVWEASQAKDQPVFDFCCTNNRVGLHLWTNTIGSSTITPGKVYVNLRANPPQNNLLYTTANPLTTGSWNHVALTYDAPSRRATIHVNGTAYDTLALPPGQKPTVSGTLLLGRRSPSTEDLQAGAHFIGRLDDVRIYDGALTGAQVDSLHKAFAPGITIHETYGPEGNQQIAIPVSQDEGNTAATDM